MCSFRMIQQFNLNFTNSSQIVGMYNTAIYTASLELLSKTVLIIDHNLICINKDICLLSACTFYAVKMFANFVTLQTFRAYANVEREIGRKKLNRCKAQVLEKVQRQSQKPPKSKTQQNCPKKTTIPQSIGMDHHKKGMQTVQHKSKSRVKTQLRSNQDNQSMAQ